MKAKKRNTFSWSELPDYMLKYFETYELGPSWYVAGVTEIEYKVNLLPDHETGNDHIPVSKWFVEHGAAKGEVVLVLLGEE
jgi:hypothetical protein